MSSEDQDQGTVERSTSGNELSLSEIDVDDYLELSGINEHGTSRVFLNLISPQPAGD